MFNRADHAAEWLESRVLLAAVPTLMEWQSNPSAIAADSHGNYYVAGIFSGVVDFNPKRSRTYQVDGGDASTYLARYGAGGGLYWVIAFQSSLNAEADVRSMATDARGDVFLAGAFDGEPTRDRATGAWSLSPENDPLVSSTVWKFRRDGSFSFGNQVVHTAGELVSATFIAVDRFGSIYTTDDTATRTIHGSFNIHSVLTKSTRTGERVWSVPLSESRANSLTIDRHDNPWVTGTYFEKGADLDVYVASSFNGRGRFLDAVPIASGEGLTSGSIAFDTEDNIVAAGGFVGTWDFDPGEGERILSPKWPEGTPNIFLSKITPRHELLFASVVGARDQDTAIDVDVDSSGTIRLAGIFNGVVDFDPSQAGKALLETPPSIARSAQELFVASYDHRGRFVTAMALPEDGTDATGAVFSRGTALILGAKAQVSNLHRTLVWRIPLSA